MITTTDITKLFGNNALRATINQLLVKKEFPNFTILCGPMGVGKSTMARIIAETLIKENTDKTSSIHVINCAAKPDISNIESNYLRFSPMEPIVLIFEEFHGLLKDSNEQTILLNILDKLPSNVYLIATTTELHKIQRPIISRSIKFEFKLLSVKEMSNMLDSYLKAQNISFNHDIKSALIHTSKGVPRDLLKTVDLIIKGDLSNEQIMALVEYVSDNSLFAIFSSLKTESVSFSVVIEDLMLSMPSNQLQSMRDFWSRFLLMRKGSTEITIDKNIFQSLKQLYDDKDIMLITEVLLNTDVNKLVLDLLHLNMKLTNTSNKQMVGVQTVQKTVKENETKGNKNVVVNSRQKLTKQSLQQFKLST